ncbi:MAG: hypothetical protein JXA04_05435 [Gammaproteobacteria bacterium]|nr:hypothetical protein [Gammaproteobacteria bacterium]
MTIQKQNACFQHGVALITALVMLLILTLLGVAAMNTTSLEEKMAINMQQEFASFHASESGQNQVFLLPNSIVYGGDNTMQITTPDGAVVDVETRYRQDTIPAPAGSGYGVNSRAQHFDVHTTASVNKSQTSVRSGMYQIVAGGAN